MSDAPQRQVYNARIADVLPGEVTEQIATVVTFQYDPITQKSFFKFTSKPYAYVNGQPMNLSGVTTSLSRSTDAILATTYGTGLYDPVTGMDLSKLSVAGLAVYLKNAFDILINEDAKANGFPNPNLPYPSAQAIAQANGLIDLYGQPPANPITAIPG